MSQLIYLIILLVLPLALNIAIWSLMYHMRDSMTLAYTIRYLFSKTNRVESIDYWWTRMGKTLRNGLHIAMYPLMHVLFWFACGMHPISHIAALFANILYWLVTNRFVLQAVNKGIEDSK